MGQSPLADTGTSPTLPESELLAAIVDSSDDAIVGKTIDGVITSWNPAAQRIYGYSAEEIIGRPVAVLFPPDRADEIGAILAAMDRGERLSHHESVRLRKDGTTFPVSATISPVLDEGATVIGT